MAELITDHIGLLDSGHIVSMEYEPELSPSSPKPEKDSSTPLAYWGEGNDLPQQIIERTMVDTELPALLDWKGRALQGREVIALDLIWDDSISDYKPVRINDDEINEFLQQISFKRYWREASIDFVWFANIFPDLIKSKGKDKIAYLGVHKAEWCRWEKQDKNGVIKKCYVSPDWPSAQISDRERVKDHAVVDPYENNMVENVRKDKAKRFVYPVSYPTPGAAYYPRTPWASFVFSHWYDLKMLIPRMKKSLMEKLLAARWMISIPIGYWKHVYPDWDTYKPEKKRDLKKAKLKEVENSLIGAENAGRVVLGEIGVDENGRDLQGWKIEPIKDTDFTGQNLEESREASQHLMRALGTDPTLVGDGPGKSGAGGGSGSDKRIAFNIFVALLQPYRDVLLEPLYFIAKYNGWTDRYKNIRFKVLEIELSTLDTKTTSKEVAN